MKLKILSDLHLETPKSYDIFEVTAGGATHLALIGDIGNTNHKGLFEFLERQLSVFGVVFFLLGNHEPYHSDWAKSKLEVQRFSDTVARKKADGAQLGDFVFLDQTRYDISATLTILGCTLYSKVTPQQYDHVSFGLNDFYQIRDWTVEKHNSAHASDLAWLNEQVISISDKEPHRKVVVLTHHSPSTDPRTLDPAHANSKISSGFSTDLSNEPSWTNGVVRLWAFGHTHFNCDYYDGVKRVFTNQRGYYFAQAPGFDETKVVEVE